MERATDAETICNLRIQVGKMEERLAAAASALRTADNLGTNRWTHIGVGVSVVSAVASLLISGVTLVVEIFRVVIR